MKKKTLTGIVAAALIAALLFIPAVQSLAVSVLSTFRVGETKTILISPGDLEALAKTLEAHKQRAESATDAPIANAKESRAHKAQPEAQPRALSSASEFTAFSFDLPLDLRDQTPTIHAMDSHSETIAFDVAAVNEKLAAAGSQTRIDTRFDKTNITITTPPAVMATYEDVALYATQGPDIDAPADLKTALWSAIVELPEIPAGIRSQLREIDPQTRDIYLPVISGVGRETQIGAITGYLYTMADVEALHATLPETFQWEKDAPKSGEKQLASVLIWTKDGVLYALFGEKDDAELSAIARSIHG